MLLGIQGRPMAISRRSLPRNASGIAALPPYGRRASATMSRQQAEVILHSGHIITIDSGQPLSQ